ncbi:MAG: substrate-binding domain-containing protein [Chloroflexi bacterium]|nr:substrate-binding domain-containing protein [Chloroflexota bacterium]
MPPYYLPASHAQDDDEPRIFSYIVDNSIDAILTTDATFQIVYANEACKKLVGQDIVGQPLSAIWFGEDLPLLNQITEWAGASSFFSAARLGGFREVLDRFPAVKIISVEAANWDREVAYNITRDLLRINPPGALDVIWAASSEMALGALAAVKQARRQNEVRIFSNDVTPESVERIRAGELVAETHHGFAEWGWYGAKFAIMHALGHPVPASFDIRPRTVYRQNVDSFYPTLSLEPIDWDMLKAERKLPERIVIGWIQMGDTGVYRTATEYFQKAAQDAMQHGLNVNIVTRSPFTPEDLSGQIAIIEDYIAEGVDAIALSTIAIDDVKLALRKALNAGIAVIVVNQLEPIEGVDVTSYIGFENLVAGKVSGYAVANWLGGPGILRNEEAATEASECLDIHWWQNVYREIEPDQSTVAGRVAIIEGIPGSWRGENRLNTVDGTTIHADSITYPIYDQASRFRGLIASFRDATQRKRAEAYLTRALDKELQLNRMRELFVTNMSHEIRTPLSIINLSVEAIRRYGSRMTDESRDRKLDQIVDQVNHMVRLLDKMLSIRAVESGKVTMIAESIDLQAVCRSLADEIQISAPNHRIECTYHGVSRQVILDRNLLLQVIVNLLSNAVKFSPNGGTIGVQVNGGDDAATIVVQDFGIGIPAHELELIFENFYRASNVGSIGGAGLGLAMVRDALALHGGSIHVDSLVGAGSTFSVRLPYLKAPPSAVTSPE